MTCKIRDNIRAIIHRRTLHVIHVSEENLRIRKEATGIRRFVRAFTSKLAASLSARMNERKGEKISAECKYDKNPRVIRLTRIKECSSRRRDALT